MKKLFCYVLIILNILICSNTVNAADVMPKYVNQNLAKTLGLYQVSEKITLFEQPDEKSQIIHCFTWDKNYIFPENTKFEDLFTVYIEDKGLALMAVTDETEDWVEVVYNHSEGSKGWIKKDDPYKFMTWVNFMNIYGRKYGLYKLQGAPKNIENIKSAPEDTAQNISTLNHPEKINLNVIRGYFALVSVYDLDRTPKTGFIRWRSNDGVKYFFPNITP